MEATVEGIEQIADARVLDVISLGTDQDAQENFFHPERQDPRRTGAGGVPVRSADDYRALYAASRRGNYPLMRTYSGTDDFVRLAEMYVERSTSPGPRCRSSGSTRWTAAARMTSRLRSACTRS